MLYYVLNTHRNTFNVFSSTREVGTHILGRIIHNIVIFKVDENGERMYIPSDSDVTKIKRELEAL